jgi:tRNA-dihydrouridine synthase B
MTNVPFNEHSLFFAPMEGVTDIHYRNVITDHFPEWDYVATDFLRIPSVGMYPQKHIIKHFGKSAYENAHRKNKTIYQILTSDNALTTEHVTMIKDLGFEWLDINLGCPSKTVCKNKGGSFLLSELPTLRRIIREIRTNFPHTFTAKIRVGYRDDSNFEQILHLLEEEGVDAITIHARTRDELYKGVANWDYVKKAVSITTVPIIGNGDIWSVEDIHRYFDYTKAHSVMIARGAMKTPWLAQNFHQDVRQEDPLTFIAKMQHYYQSLYQQMENNHKLEELGKIRRLKAVSRYIFDDLPNGAVVKKKFLLSKTRDEIFNVIHEMPQLIQ